MISLQLLSAASMHREEAGLSREAVRKLPPPRSSLHSDLLQAVYLGKTRDSCWFSVPRGPLPGRRLGCARRDTSGRSGDRGLQGQPLSRGSTEAKSRSYPCPRSRTFLASTFSQEMAAPFLFAGSQARKELHRRDLWGEDSSQWGKNIDGEDTGRKVTVYFSLESLRF